MVRSDGALIPGFTLTWTVAKEVNRPEHSGIATSVVNVGIFLGTGILQPLVGGCSIAAARTAIHRSAWDAGMLLLAGSAAFGALMTLFVRERNMADRSPSFVRAWAVLVGAHAGATAAITLVSKLGPPGWLRDPLGVFAVWTLYGPIALAAKLGATRSTIRARGMAVRRDYARRLGARDRQLARDPCAARRRLGGVAKPAPIRTAR